MKLGFPGDLCSFDGSSYLRREGAAAGDFGRVGARFIGGSPTQVRGVESGRRDPLRGARFEGRWTNRSARYMYWATDHKPEE